MKYYSSLIRLLLTILMISILSFQPYIASAEETTATGDVEVETDELEDIDKRRFGYYSETGEYD